jgi:hypothetical protein
MTRSQSRAARRWRWVIVIATALVAAVTFTLLVWGRPQVVVYPTTDFAGLPISAASSAPAKAPSCVSLRGVNGVTGPVDEPCGTPASTFRVIGRVAQASQCVPDADLTYSWTANRSSGTMCLDYDWVADQCLRISDNAVSKVDCTDRAAVRPELAIIGAVDVSYCLGGGIAHRVRHFTVCTLAGDKDCNRRTHGT